MNVRKLHRSVGLAFSVFFLITAVTGIALLLRNAGVYETGTKNFLLGLHNWELVAKYIGAVMAAGLICMTLTGLTMLIRAAKRKQ